MFASEENVRALSDLGLSPNQAKVYLSVLQTEGLPVHDISKIAKVNREDVYRVVLRLEKMGLIEKILGNPIVNKSTTMINNAKNRIDAIYSENQLLQFVPIFADQLAKACEKGVTAR